MKDIFAFFDRESDNPSLDVPACAKRLSAAIQCRTVNDGGDGSGFRALHALIRESFPRVMAQGALEIIGRSMLITLTGADQNLRPCLCGKYHGSPAGRHHRKHAPGGRRAL